MSVLELHEDREIDVILVGRAGVDLNADDANCTFTENRSFTKTVGGSPANIAISMAKIGLKPGFIGKVSNDAIGQYILDEFNAQGVDTQGVLVDKTGAVNCLAFTEILSPTNCRAYLYRDNVADIKINPNEISEDYIKSAKAVLISGTALSESPSREAMFTIIEYARKNGTKIMIDLDYRKAAWQSEEEAAIYYSMAAEKCDVLIGNREEFNALEYFNMPGNTDSLKSSNWWLERGCELVIIKHGEKGSEAYTADGQVVKAGIVPTKIRKTYGSGDSYAAGLTYGLFNGMSLKEAMELGSTCAAIVLAGYSCSKAMPTLEEALEYLKEKGCSKPI